MFSIIIGDKTKLNGSKGDSEEGKKKCFPEVNGKNREKQIKLSREVGEFLSIEVFKSKTASGLLRIMFCHSFCFVFS